MRMENENLDSDTSDGVAEMGPGRQQRAVRSLSPFFLDAVHFVPSATLAVLAKFAATKGRLALAVERANRVLPYL
jgi:hypothetical protein